MKYQLVATLKTSMSHHHSEGDGSNFNLFRRKEQFITVGNLGRMPTQAETDRVCAALPVPADPAWIFDNISLAQFIGAALAKEFITAYGGKDGTGLFSGVERYTKLVPRFRQSAVMSSNLVEFWSLLTGKMLCGITPMRDDRHLLTILKVAPSLASLVLSEIAKHGDVIVMLGRQWTEDTKLQSEDYVAALESRNLDVQLGDQESVVLSFDVLTQDVTERVVLPVPSISANALRSQLRKASMWHLLDCLSLEFSELPRGIQALLYNGGNLAQGAKKRSAEDRLNSEILMTYPSLGLFSGCTNYAIMGEGNLSVFAWLMCRENNSALDEQYHVQISAFDMLEPVTHYQHVLRLDDESPMPFGFEALAQGSQFAIELHLSPWSSRLERGALVATVEKYIEVDGTFGGQAARGYGLLDLSREWSQDDAECLAEYEVYLVEHKDELSAGLMSGELCAGVVMCR